MQADTFFDDIGDLAFSDLGVIPQSKHSSNPQSKHSSNPQSKQSVVLPVELTESDINFTSDSPLVELVESICMNDEIMDKDAMIYSVLIKNIKVTSEEYVEVIIICLSHKFVKCYTLLYPTVNKTGLYACLTSMITLENCLLLNELFNLDSTLELPFLLVHVILKTKIYSKLPKFIDIFQNSLYLIDDNLKVILLAISFAYDIPDITIKIMDDMLTKLSEHCLIDVYMPAFLRNKDDKNKEIILYLIACSNHLLPEGTTNFEEFKVYVLQTQQATLQEYIQFTSFAKRYTNPAIVEQAKQQLKIREQMTASTQNPSTRAKAPPDSRYISVCGYGLGVFSNSDFITKYLDDFNSLKQISFKENLDNLLRYYDIYDKKYKYNCWLRLRCIACNSKATYELKSNKFINNEELELCSTHPNIRNINLKPFNTFDLQPEEFMFRYANTTPHCSLYKQIRRNHGNTTDRDVPVEQISELHDILSKVEYTETKTKCILLDCGHINPIDTLLDTYYYDLFNGGL